jgi:hypothetical protein
MPNESSPIQMSDFMNPSSMMTPGVLGGLVMTLSNTFYGMFALEPRWSALILSFLCGLIVFNSAVPKARAIIFYLLNSLIILSMANGANALGFAVAKSQQAFELNLTTTAYAGGDTNFIPVYSPPCRPIAVTTPAATNSITNAIPIPNPSTNELPVMPPTAAPAAPAASPATKPAAPAQQSPAEQRPFFQRSWY